MELVILFLVAVAVVGVLRRAAALLLGVAAWVGLVLMGLGVLTGVPVPTGILVATVALWFASQYASKMRRGDWRSPVLRLLVR